MSAIHLPSKGPAALAGATAAPIASAAAVMAATVRICCPLSLRSVDGGGNRGDFGVAAQPSRREGAHVEIQRARLGHALLERDAVDAVIIMAVAATDIGLARLGLDM